MFTAKRRELRTPVGISLLPSEIRILDALAFITGGARSRVVAASLPKLIEGLSADERTRFDRLLSLSPSAEAEAP